MNETTKNTLLEAKNAALRAELDEANKKLAAVKADNSKIAENQRTIKKLEANADLAKKQIAQLTANQLTGDQSVKIKSYDKLSAALNERNRELMNCRSDLSSKSAALERIEGELESVESQAKQFVRAQNNAVSESKKSRRKMWISTAASVLFAVSAAGGSFYYVQGELAPSASLSPEALEAFKRHAPEYRKIIDEQTARERSSLDKESESLRSERFELSKDRPGFFDSYVIPFLYVIGAFILGFVFGIGFFLTKLLR